MGGYGSGRHFQKEYVKAERESLPCLCTTTWMRADLLGANQDKKGLWGWTRGDIFNPLRQTVAYEIETDDVDGTLRLSYCYKGEPVEYEVPVLTRPEPFGGCRWYFGCPIIGHEQKSPCQRATRLYKLGRYFGCRFCLNLCYRSQNENDKLKRLSRRFGVDLGALESSMTERLGWYRRCWVGNPSQ